MQIGDLFWVFIVLIGSIVFRERLGELTYRVWQDIQMLRLERKLTETQHVDCDPEIAYLLLVERR